ncbi:MAG: ankyrin repeat domain-containing protein [Lysobacterales bacterium]
MRKSATERMALKSGIGLLLPALVLFAGAGSSTHPAILVPLLLADALVMAAICQFAGFGREPEFVRGAVRRGVVHFVLLVAWTGVLALLSGAPAWWLASGGAWPTAVLVAVSTVIALLVAWRTWPAFALPFVWDDAFASSEEPGSWLLAAVGRSLAFARHLTGRRTVFLRHGLPASIALILVGIGALGLAWFGNVVPGRWRIAAVVAYALIIAPLGAWIVVNRTLRVIIADARQSRRRDVAKQAGPGDDGEESRGSRAATDPDATLLCAARSGQVDLALAALEHGASPEAKPPEEARDQRNALLLAVTLADPRLLRTLIAKGVDLNRVQGGITPLIAATRDSYQGRPDAVMTLLSNGADPRRADAEHNTALHHAARCVEPSVAALLLDAAADINAVNSDGETPLGTACANANWELARYLLGRGARPEVEGAQPALLLAAGVPDDDPAGVALLLKKKARVDAVGRLGRTALLTAARAGHVAIAQALLHAGAGPDLADAAGTTPLMDAARAGSAEVVRALGARKADVELADSHGRSALLIACQAAHGSEDTVRALLALGAERQHADADGKRPVEYAAAAGRWQVVALIDPDSPLPSSLAGPRIEGASGAHLVDALRFGNWEVAAGYDDTIREWPREAWADLYVALVEDGAEPGRRWLLNRGLREATMSDGQSLSNALLARLPAGVEALRQFVATGVPVGGAGVIARVLAGSPTAAQVTLALDLLARGVDVHGSHDGNTAVHLAAALGEPALLSELLVRGADPNARDAQGRAPLHRALQLGTARAIEPVKRLIAAGANPELAAANGETPLGLALARSDRELSYWLSWPRWHLPGRRLSGEDLPAAAVVGDIDAVERLLGLGVPIDARDAHGATALIRAAGAGYAALVVRLLDAGADRECRARSGANCLAAAVSAQREAVVRTLLNHGVSADLPLPGGATPLAIAAALGLPRIAAALLEAGASINATDAQGSTPLHAAAHFTFASGDAQNARSLIELLLRTGADVNALNSDGQPPLLLLLGARADPGTACNAQPLAALAEQFALRGARLDVQDRRGVSALHACAMHGLLGCARLLRARGARTDLVDVMGRRAGEVAALLGYVDVAAELGAAREGAVAPKPSSRRTSRVER